MLQSMGSQRAGHDLVTEQQQQIRPLCVSVPKHKFLCPMHSEAKQTQNIRVWSRQRFIAGACKENE